MGPSIGLGAVCTRQQRLIGAVFSNNENGWPSSAGIAVRTGDNGHERTRGSWHRQVTVVDEASCWASVDLVAVQRLAPRFEVAQDRQTWSGTAAVYPSRIRGLIEDFPARAQVYIHTRAGDLQATAHDGQTHHTPVLSVEDPGATTEGALTRDTAGTRRDGGLLDLIGFDYTKVAHGESPFVSGCEFAAQARLC
jgi:hypothetical protein